MSSLIFDQARALRTFQTEEQLCAFLQMFVDMYADSIDEINAAAPSRKQLADYLHRASGPAHSLGLLQLARASNELEKKLLAEQETPAEIEEIKRIYQRTLDDLTAYIKESEKGLQEN